MVVAGPRAGIDDPAARATLARVVAVLRSDDAVSGVPVPQVSRRSQQRGRLGLAGAAPDEMVEAAGRLKARLARLSSPGVAVRLTGPAAMWSDFNAANKAAMLKSELLSWPLTLVLLVFAFGTLVAAGLPLLLTMAGLLGAGGLLFVFGQFADVSIWAMNFAMMFAIALGIDYALFIVVRFRSALAAGLAPREATALTMATAGKAVLVSGLTVIAALLALTLVPVPAFRTVPLGIGLAVLMVLAATLTLLPAVLVAPGSTGSTAAACACAARSIIAASASRRGARACGRGRFRTAPRPSRSCCCSPSRRSGCGPGCRPPPRCRRDAGSREGQELLRAGVRGRRRERAPDRGARAGRGGRAVGARARPGHRRGRAARSARAATCCSPPSPTARADAPG